MIRFRFEIDIKTFTARILNNFYKKAISTTNKFILRQSVISLKIKSLI